MMFKTYLKQYREIITENDAKNGICFDGVVEPKRYFEKKQRLMFLLKETNGNKSNGEKSEVLSDWDYMQWVRSQANGIESLYRSVYRNIAMWSRMLNIYTQENREPNISEIIDDNGLIIDDKLLNSLLDIAIVNLKKSWGVEQTEWQQMKNYLEGDTIRKEILLYQFDSLKPSLVLCGGTFDFAYQIFGTNSDIKEIEIANSKKISYFKCGESVFVNCYHPSRPGWSRKDSFWYMNSILKVFLLNLD